MPTLPERRCPCCGVLFTPLTLSTVTCSPACSKRAYRLRSKLKAYERGERKLTQKVIEVAQRVLAADAAVAVEKAEIEAQRKAKREAEREAQRARREAERALLVQAKETLKAQRKERKKALQSGEKAGALAERDPAVIAAQELVKSGYCNEALAYAIISRRVYEQEPEEWRAENPIWPPAQQPKRTPS
ncbi:hypothetical protein [Celeribacter halophilus]|uniref:hypothetical protein n=1 Tax=Celeribacter halophilus TaxID=576117 RepID=UPI003A915DA1